MKYYKGFEILNQKSQLNCYTIFVCKLANGVKNATILGGAKEIVVLAVQEYNITSN